ncbi:MAG: carbohydrate binding family 9 domain-containing protein, partial [Mariniphaga sp.]|nr:carbohydrate binding family 9 domain-containing protein [Mariniphaga sp.]
MRTILLFFFFSISLIATGQEVIVINKLTNDLEFDGIPNEVAWQSGVEFKMLMHAPRFGEAPSEESNIRIGFDDNYLWVSGNLYYKNAETIVSTSKKRDEESKNPDSFGIILDTYNDNENALAFFTMPAGQRIDFAVSNDAVDVPSYFGSSNINYSWNTFWDVKTARTKNGWSVEMRIPFSSLRFQVVDGKVQMGLILNRTISHWNEINTFPEIDPKYGRLAPNKPSLAAVIELEGIKESNPVYISPYVIAGNDAEWN